jgi:serine protease Do
VKFESCSRLVGVLALRPKTLFLSLLSVLICSLVAVCSVWATPGTASQSLSESKVTSTSSVSPTVSPSVSPVVIGTGFLPDFATLIGKVNGSVVNIASVNSGQPVSAGSGDGEQEQLEHPFLKPNEDSPTRSLGSGFIIDPSGYIVTNNHVVENATSIIVRISDQRTEYSAELIGRDDKTDLALIKIEPSKELTALTLGDSDSLRVGEWVVAIGNQFELGQTVTAGIVSAKSRRVPLARAGPYDQFIQTDASINPGSSGGPLINQRGEVVGINTAIFSPGRSTPFGGASPGFNIGIGFAIPVNIARGIIEQLRSEGKVVRGLLGVIIQGVNEDVAQVLGLKSAAGALVADVIGNTPAARAGFERGDVIIRYRGSAVDDHNDLPLLVAETPVGTTVEVEILRKGRPLSLFAEIKQLEEDQFAQIPASADSVKPDRIGLIVDVLTDSVAAQLSVEVSDGLLVRHIEPGSHAERAGFRPGDVILEMNSRKIDSLTLYTSLIESFSSSKPLLVLVKRREGTRFLTVSDR